MKNEDIDEKLYAMIRLIGIRSRPSEILNRKTVKLYIITPFKEGKIDCINTIAPCLIMYIELITPRVFIKKPKPAIL